MCVCSDTRSAIVAEAGAGTLGIAAAVTCICTDGEATDRLYAASSAKASGLKHIVVQVGHAECLHGCRETVKVAGMGGRPPWL
eukprot:350964-Chlamydomonas_euryale.AAC.3